MNYVVIIEKSGSSYGAYVPDLPGCVAVADTADEAMELIREAIKLHVADLRRSGQPVPAPSSSAHTVKVAA